MTWFQLTYASAESAPGRSGGWHVQQVTPGTPPAIEAQMRAGVTTRLDTLDRLDEFPSTPTLAARTRRLAFKFDDDGGSVWWHAVEAGKDASGRPGNVFTHAAAIAGLPGRLRPIDLWRSPCWMMPFGQNEVAAAALTDFKPEGALHRAAAIERAFARQEETEALLAALTTCLDRGWSLILSSESQDEFAAWLSVVSHLTAARVAAGTLPFSSFERASRLPQALEHVRVAGIPSADLEQVRDASPAPAVQRMLVLDLDNLPYTTPNAEYEYAGQRWPSGGLWQEAFFELTDTGRYTQDEVESILARMDDLAEEGDNFRDVGAPLAIALMTATPQEPARRALLEQWGERLEIGVQGIEALLSLAPPYSPAGPAQPERHDDTSQTTTRSHGLSPATQAEPVPGSAHTSTETLDITVTLPSPAHATPAHQRLAQHLLDCADVLTGEPATNRVALWVHELDRRHLQQMPEHPITPDHGVTNGPDA